MHARTRLTACGVVSQHRPYGRGARAALGRLADLAPRTKVLKRQVLAEALLPAVIELVRDRDNLPLQVPSPKAWNDGVGGAGGGRTF